VPLAPPAPRAAHRRPPLITVRRTVAAVIAAAVLMACSSDDAAEAPDTSSSNVSTTEPATGGLAEEEDASDPATTVGDASTPKVEPARTAGDVDAPAGVEPDGFTTATVRVISSDGQVCDVCLWLADTGDERGRGLMGVTDLGEPVGMLFRWDGTTSGNFFMFNTPMPLSIAWFAADGTHVFEADMEPCLVDDSSDCERYGPSADYQYAVEMVQGELGVIGIGPGSTIEVLAEHDTCPVVE